MQEEPQPPMARSRRRSLVIDPSMQWTAALAVGMVVETGLFMIVALRRLQLGSDDAAAAGGGLLRSPMLWTLLVLGVVLAAIVTLVLFLTHRVAGPARTLAHAVDGLCENDFSRRCRVRRHDHLQHLSLRVARLTNKLRIDRQRMRIFLDRVEADVYGGDRERASAAIRAFRHEWGLEGPIDPTLPDGLEERLAASAAGPPEPAAKE